MAQLFHRGANNIAKASLVLAVVLGGLAFFAYTYIARSSYLTGRYVEKQQPVQFSHRHHVGDDGIDCRYCHTSVETAASAGIPPTQTCMNCHGELYADQEYLEPIRASFRDNKPIKWERVHDLPGFAYFNHSIHVAKGVGCASCHGDVANMAAVYQENTLQMEWCLSCHRDPKPNIRPKSEIYNTSWDSKDITPEQQKEVDEKISKLRSKELLTSCSTCHR
ncbi:MAG: cytochrome c3 family protein [Pyrinomonadaceae bacterium]|nr:cytochrome c3 family protein [Pyrinomonadaceae bacterium]